MSRKSYWSVLGLVGLTLVFSTLAFLTGCSSSSSSTSKIVTIAATSGGGQSAQVGAAFANPLVATVMTGTTPTSGVTVTFTAPATGASGTFGTPTPGATDTETTNASGVATSQVFTANTTAGAYTVTATVTGAATPANFSLTNTAGAAANLAATSGGGQSATVSTAFANPLVATVTDSGTNPVAGVSVTFTAPASGASGLFADGGTAALTDTEVTDANGNATSTVFTANATVGGPYNVVASSTGLTSVNFALTNTAVVVVTPPLPDGTYAFSLAGLDVGDNSFFDLAGAFTIAGGVITGGEQDFVDNTLNASDTINAAGSSVVATADGNILLTLATADTSIGVNGVETFSVSMLPVNTSKGLIIEFDSSASASGEIDLQDPTAAAATPSLGYAFVVNGGDFEENALAIGGVINVDGAGTISGTGSIFDANDGGGDFPAETFAPSTVSAPPDSFGRVAFTLNATDATDFPQIILVGYIIDANRILLVEGADSFLGAMGGVALSQGAKTGTFGTASASGNSYVLGMAGADGNFLLQAVGLFTFNSGGTVSGFVDFNDLTVAEPTSPDPVTAPAYTVDPTGRVTIAGLTDGVTNGVDINLQLYLNGNGRALGITLDTGDVLGGAGSQQTGPFAATSFSGAYAVDATGFDVNGVGELDAVGPVTATGNGGTFAGTVDLNWAFGSAPVADLTVSGTYTSNADGIFTGTVTGLDVTTTTNVDVFNYYLFDATGDNIAIETDLNQMTLGLFEQ